MSQLSSSLRSFNSYCLQGAWLVNTARGAICDKDAVAAALKAGQINGYAGDVWNVQPAPKDHPWRTMKNPLGGGNGMVPHYSGTTLDAQARYAAGVKSILRTTSRTSPRSQRTSSSARASTRPRPMASGERPKVWIGLCAAASARCILH